MASNGIWFAAQYFVIDIMVQVVRSRDVQLGALALLFYTTLTTTSSVAMQWFLMRKVEERIQA